ncbi:MAG: hypothetical protein ACRCUY_07275, partial [Thermoguttaceae bacterium]
MTKFFQLRLILSFLFILLPNCWASPIFGAESDVVVTDEYFRSAVPRSERFLTQMETAPTPESTFGVRTLLDHLYYMLFANQFYQNAGSDGSKKPTIPIDRLGILLSLAETMQDQNESSRTYGNFRWYWRTPEVTDQNAVEFV